LITFIIGAGSVDAPAPPRCRRRLRDRERDAENRVRTEPALVRRAVQLDEGAVDELLVGAVEVADRFGDLAVDVRDRLRDALASPLRSAVAQLDRLVHARGRSGGDGRPAGTSLHLRVDLDGRIAARVEDLAGMHCDHPVLSLARSK
jgi:hypothetical protein